MLNKMVGPGTGQHQEQTKELARKSKAVYRKKKIWKILFLSTDPNKNKMLLEQKKITVSTILVH
jgi:hypothetical protein